nr:MAG TPA: hypothetical protein [Caudoviricetes sp.]
MSLCACGRVNAGKERCTCRVTGKADRGDGRTRIDDIMRAEIRAAVAQLKGAA